MAAKLLDKLNELPKFKEGDWYVHLGSNIYQIGEICGYIVEFYEEVGLSRRGHPKTENANGNAKKKNNQGGADKREINGTVQKEEKSSRNSQGERKKENGYKHK